MKAIYKAVRCLLVLAMIGTVSVSGATVITDTYDPHPDRLVTTFNSPFTYTHDLRSQGIPGRTVNSASVMVYLYDITDFAYAFGEKVTFTFDNVASSSVSNVSFFGQNYTFGLTTSMLSDGLLSVSLSAGCSGKLFGHCVVPQDFVFAKSVLTADVSDPVNDVPEPGTLACIGIGLLLLSLARGT